MPNDDNDDDDKDDIKSKKSESISINPGGAFIELQRIAEIVTEMKAEPVPSHRVPTLENSILELGNKLGLNRFDTLTELRAALTKQNGLGVNFTFDDILSIADHLAEISEMNFQNIRAQAEDMMKCLTYIGGPHVNVDEEWDDNGRDTVVFQVKPKFFWSDS